MIRFFRFLLRLVAVTVGFAVACFVAACLEVLLNAAMVPGALGHLEARGLDLRLTLGLLGLSGLIGHAAFLPSAVMILVGEIGRLRGWLVYVLGGAIIAGIVVVLADRAGVAIAMDVRHVAVNLVCGMVGGFGYWLVAGRNAGRWLPSQSTGAGRSDAAGSAALGQQDLDGES